MTWIGISVSATTEELVLTMNAKFMQKLLDTVRELSGLRSIPMRRLRSLAGGLSWLAGLIRWIRPFLAPLWGAIAVAAAWDGPPERAAIGRNQVQGALSWILTFLQGEMGPLMRRIGVPPRMVQRITQIICDACPWGMGAVLAVDGTPIQWFGIPISDLDLEILGVARGDCRGQAALEALCICVALREWAHEWQDETSALLTRSDAIAALGALNRGASGNPTMNLICKEVALDLAGGAYDLEILGHLPAQWNTTADALSRLHGPPEERKDIPSELAGARRIWPATRTRAWRRTLD